MVPPVHDLQQVPPPSPHQALGVLLLDSQSSRSSPEHRQTSIEISLKSDRRRRLSACASYEHRHYKLRAVRINGGEKLARE